MLMCSLGNEGFLRVVFMATKRAPELVKVAGVAPTELQELGGGSQSQPTTQPPS